MEYEAFWASDTAKSADPGVGIFNSTYLTNSIGSRRSQYGFGQLGARRDYIRRISKGQAAVRPG